MPRSIVMLLVLSLVGGCTAFDHMIESLEPQQDPLDIALILTSTEGEAASRELIEEVHRRYEANPTDQNLLAVAVTYAVPGHKMSSTDVAMEFLDKVDLAQLNARSRALARFLITDLTYRISLEQQTRDLERQVSESTSALSRAQEKIRILTRIEKTIGSPAQGGAEPGNASRHDATDTDADAKETSR